MMILLCQATKCTVIRVQLQVQIGDPVRSLQLTVHPQMNKLYIDKPAKWTKILRHTHSADPVGMGRKSRLYIHYIFQYSHKPKTQTIFQYSLQAQFSAHTNWISCKFWAQYPCLPFCVLIYLKGTMSRDFCVLVFSSNSSSWSHQR